MHFFAQRTLFCLNFVKARTEYPTYIGDGDEGIWVDLVYQTEDQRALGFAYQDGDHLDRLLGVPSGAVQDRHAAVNRGVDGSSEFLVLGRVDQEMNGLMHPRHEPIDCDGIGDRHRHTIKHAFDLKIDRIPPLRQHRLGQRQEERRGDNNNIARQHDISERYIPVMIDDHRDDIRASGRPVSRQYCPQTESEDEAADDGSQPRILDDRFRQDRYHAVPERDCRNAYHRPDAEPPTYRETCYQKQYGVEHESRQPDRDRAAVFGKERGEESAGDIIDRGADTRQSAADKRMRQKYPVDHQCHGEDTENDHQVFKHRPYPGLTRRIVRIYKTMKP